MSENQKDGSVVEKSRSNVADIFNAYYDYWSFEKRDISMVDIAKQFSITRSMVQYQLRKAKQIARGAIRNHDAIRQQEILKRAQRKSKVMAEAKENLVRKTGWAVFSADSSKIRICNHSKSFFTFKTLAIFSSEYDAKEHADELSKKRKCVHCSPELEVREISMKWYGPKKGNTKDSSD